MTDLVAPADRTDWIRLDNGRRLAWHEWGPERGFPVLFCTGAGMSGALGFGAGDLDRLNVRLLAVDRPGLGASDRHDRKTLTSWAEDVGELIAARRLENPLAVGFSQGAPFALALAAARRVAAAAMVSGQDDFTHPATVDRLPADVAAFVAAAREDPGGFEERIAAEASAAWLWGLITGMSAECDRAIYEGAPFGTLYRACLDDGFVQGGRGYARDLAITLGPWPFSPERISVPVDFWYGGRDASPVHSPDFGETLAGRLPDATRTVDDAAGSAILWTRAADILGQLVARAAAATPAGRGSP